MIKLSKILNENKSSTHLIVVDVQPEYERSINFDILEFFEYISTYDNVIYLYNGYDTLGMISEPDLKNWILEYVEYDDDFVNFMESKIKFYDKGYAFFRSCMDQGINDNSIVSLVKYMYKNDLRDSRDLNKLMWSKFKGKYPDETISELLECADECLYIPDLMDELININGTIILVGGGIDECLKEVEIALLALDKKYTVKNEWTY